MYQKSHPWLLLVIQCPGIGVSFDVSKVTSLIIFIKSATMSRACSKL